MTVLGQSNNAEKANTLYCFLTGAGASAGAGAGAGVSMILSADTGINVNNR